MNGLDRCRNAALALVFCTACSSSIMRVGSQYAKTGVIGPSGGTLTVTASDDPAIAGTSITIPPGALSAPTTIEIGGTIHAVVSSGALGPVVDFEPSGTAFAKPATVSIPVSLPAGVSASRVGVMAVEANGSSRTITPLTVASGLVTFQTSGFTFFGGFELPSDDAGCSPSCADGAACGSSDGCGGTCDANCDDAGCSPSCADGAACGSSDGCGGTCNANCDDAGCTPSCGEGTCGTSDGCGGTCPCPDAGCTPSCGEGTCGTSDGCGGTCPCPDAGSDLFYPPVNYAVSVGPHALTTFQNTGGNIGLAMADYGDGMVWVLLGAGDGTFTSGGSYNDSAAQPSLQYICSADFNGDGLADLAVSTWQNANGVDMVLFSGTADAGFSYANSEVADQTSYQVITADINSDGLPDLILIEGPSIYVGLGQGDGGFVWGTGIGGVGYPRGLAVGNFGFAGGPQIAVADNGSDQVWVLQQTGGVFSALGPWAVGSQPIGIAAADFNGDGCTDLVTGNNVGDSVSVLLNTCDGGFGVPYNYSEEGGRPQWLITADFNGDGNQDIAVAFYDSTETGANVALYLGNGDGTFQDPIYYQADEGPSDIVNADFNGDGKMDFAVSNWVSNDVSVFIHR